MEKYKLFIELKGAYKMDSSLLDKLVSMGFKTENDFSIGVFKNYPTSLVFSDEKEEKDEEPLCIANIAVELYDPKKLQKQLPQNSDNQIHFITKGNSATSVSFVIANLTQKQAVDTLEKFLSIIADLLVQNNIKPQTKCCLCNKSITDNFALFPDETDNETILARPIHSDCVKEQHADAMSRANSSSNPIISLLFAIIGAFIGAVPTILTIITIEREMAILEILIPLGAFYCWRLLGKGKASPFAAFSILAISIFMALSTYTISALLITNTPFSILTFITTFFIILPKLNITWLGLLVVTATTISQWSKMAVPDIKTAEALNQLFMLKGNPVAGTTKRNES